MIYTCSRPATGVVQAFADADPVCVTCGKRPRVLVSDTGDGFCISAKCHGATSQVSVEFNPHVRDPYDDLGRRIPRRWFLRNWAAYTIKPATPKGRAL